MTLTRLFEPYQMGKVRLRNRLVFAGHGSRFVDPGAWPSNLRSVVPHAMTRKDIDELVDSVRQAASRFRGAVGR